jgi:6-pyruvoyltetrahydropterin/6-carboxytetrahydropterin synthase
VLVDFDHKHLNLDTPWFADRQPTTENLAAVLWDLIAGALDAAAPSGAALAHLRLYEADDLYVDYFGATA